MRSYFTATSGSRDGSASISSVHEPLTTLPLRRLRCIGYQPHEPGAHNGRFTARPVWALRCTASENSM